VRILEWQTGDRAELRAFIRPYLVAGFWSRDEVEESVAEWVDDSGQIDPEEAAALVHGMWNERLAEQTTWADTGDYGRLHYTFTQLESEGILARMCFACCTTCATSEIDFERTVNPNSPDWYRYHQWAYTYFHEQDALRLASDNPTLYLGFSAFRAHPELPAALLEAYHRNDPDAQAEVHARTDTFVGRRIVQLAQHFGLNTSWSGSGKTRIEVHADQWRKPLPTGSQPAR
jgi:hypothetical protein